MHASQSDKVNHPSAQTADIGTSTLFCIVTHWHVDFACRGDAGMDRPVISFWENANRIQADKEETHLVREFRERLRYNLQQVDLAACVVLASAILKPDSFVISKQHLLHMTVV